MVQKIDIQKIREATAKLKDGGYDCFVVAFKNKGESTKCVESYRKFEYEQAIKFISDNVDNWSFCSIGAVKREIITLWDE